MRSWPRTGLLPVQRGRDRFAGQLLFGLDAEQSNSTGRHHLVLLIEHACLPHLCAPAARDRRRDRVELCARAHRAHEARAVLETDHGLPAWQRIKRGAYGCKRFDDSAVNAAMHDSVALQVLGSNGQLAAHLVLGRESDGDAHRVEPTFGKLFHPIREVVAHTEIVALGKRRAGTSPRIPHKSREPSEARLSMSTFAVLPPPTPGVGFGKGGPRGSLPPELPAGKRGGWHHDSVYPSFRLTSFAPRALNFWVSVPAIRSALDFSLDATQICRRVRRLGEGSEACNWVVRRARCWALLKNLALRARDGSG